MAAGGRGKREGPGGILSSGQRKEVAPARTATAGRSAGRSAAVVLIVRAPSRFVRAVALFAHRRSRRLRLRLRLRCRGRWRRLGRAKSRKDVVDYALH